MMRFTVASTRPILCILWMLITGGLLFFCLARFGSVAAVGVDALTAWSVIGGGLLGWYYKDRSKLRSTEAENAKATKPTE